MVALIPARAGSKRVPKKALKKLGGMPLIGWTLYSAVRSNIFSDIQVWTDDPDVAALAESWSVKSYVRLPSHDHEPDIDWVRLWAKKHEAEQFAILRPTSPFRTAETISRAFAQFQRTPDVHSLRAVEPVKQHPGKMWWHNGPGYPLTPVCDAKRSDRTPWHSSPTQSLPVCYIQNASLEMAWTFVVHGLNTISGTKILPFFTEGYEGFDINTPDDFQKAEELVASGAVVNPFAVAAQTPLAAPQ